MSLGIQRKVKGQGDGLVGKELLCKFDDLSVILRTHVKVEAENQPHKIV